MPEHCQYLVADRLGIHRRHDPLTGTRDSLMGLKWWYRVLYSSQLGKKNKSWADGYVYFVVALRRVVLLDEAGRTLDSGSDVLAGDLQVGGELKLQNHLVSVDEGPIPEPLHFASSRPSHAASLPRQEDCGVAAEAPSRDPQRLAAKRIFAILYTKDKQRKTKRWLDGYVLLAPNAVCYIWCSGLLIAGH